MRRNKIDGQVTLDLVGRRITGIAKTIKNDKVEYVHMLPFNLMPPEVMLLASKDEVADAIEKNMNDCHTGSDSIEGGIVVVDDLYEHNFILPGKEMVIGKLTNEDKESIIRMSMGFNNKCDKMSTENFEGDLQKLKGAITEHNASKKWWQPKWKLNENFLFFSIYYNGFPNPFKIHRTMGGLSWSAFPKGYHALLKPENGLKRGKRSE